MTSPLSRLVALHALGPDDSPLGLSRLLVLPAPERIDPLALGLALDPAGALVFSASSIPMGSERCARLIVHGASQDLLDELVERVAALHPGARGAPFASPGDFQAGIEEISLLERMALDESIGAAAAGLGAPRI